MNVHQSLPRLRNFEQRVGAGRHFSEARADDEQHVGVLHALRELRIDADADVAGVIRAAVVEQVLAAERGAGRKTRGLDPFLQRKARLAVPAAAAEDDEGLLGFLEESF